eukprot:gene16191-8860_t
MGDPFQVSVGSAFFKFNLGATLVNCFLLYPAMALIHAGLTGGVYYVRKRFLDPRASLYGTMGICLFPGWLTIPFLLFYQPTLEASFRVLYFADAWPKLCVFPVVVIFACGLPWLVWHMTSPKRFMAHIVTYERMRESKVKIALFGADTWDSEPDFTWIDRWGMLFWDYTQRERRFLVWEMLSLVALSMIGATSPSNFAQCLLKVGGVVVMFLVMLVYVWLRRPFLAAYDKVMYLSCLSLELVACTCAFFIVAKNDPRADTYLEEAIANAMMTAAVVMLFVKTACDFLLFSYEKFRDRRDKAMHSALDHVLAPEQREDASAGSTRSGHGTFASVPLHTIERA